MPYRRRFFFDAKKGYVKDGLVIHLDAINNTGDGHSSTVSTWTDLSGSNNNCSIDGYNPSMWNADKILLNGSGQGVKTPLLNIPNNSFTFEIVFDSKELTTRGVIFGNHMYSTHLSFGIEVNSGAWTDGSVRLYWDGNPDVKLSNTRVVAGKMSLSVVFDKPNKTFKSYVNGVLKDTVSNPLFANNLTAPYYYRVGRDERMDLSNWNAYVYGVRFYNRPLTDAEVGDNYKIDFK